MEVDDRMECEQSGRMYLCKETAYALDLTESNRVLHRTGKSLYSILNRCKTNSGKKLLAEWLESPLIDIDAISKLRIFVRFCRLFLLRIVR